MIGTILSLEYDATGALLRSAKVLTPQHAPEVLNISTVGEGPIGVGAFGSVYRARCPQYPNFALKVAKGKSSRLKEELGTMARVCTTNHPTVVEVYFVAHNNDEKVGVIGMELCIPLTLHDYLLSRRLTEESEMLYFAYQALMAVEAVHAVGCCHRDVKLQNFIFDLDGVMKLIDFGLASTVLTPPPGDVVAGTVSFMAPEMARNALSNQNRASVGQPADIWGLGILLFSIFTQRNPYPTIPELSGVAPGNQLLEIVAKGEWQWPQDVAVMDAEKELVERLLVLDSSKRPTVRQLLSSRLWNQRAHVASSSLIEFIGTPRAASLRAPEFETPQRSSTKPEEDQKVVLTASATPSPFPRLSRTKPKANPNEFHKDEMPKSQKSKTAKEPKSSTAVAAQHVAAVRDTQQVEKQLRDALQNMLLLQLHQLCSYVRLVVAEDQGWYFLSWLEGNQRVQAAHPHQFRFTSAVPKGYEHGFACDVCAKEYFPVVAGSSTSSKAVRCSSKGTLPHHHCDCGMDVCPVCFTNFQQLCTCVCGKKHPNLSAFRTHCATCKTFRKNAPAEISVATARGGKASHQPKGSVQKRAPSPDVVPNTKRDQQAVPDANLPKPFLTLTSKKKHRVDGAAAQAATEEERNYLLNNAWVRYFHFWPSDEPNSNARSNCGRHEFGVSDGKVALTYHIQPGRTGAIFLAPDSPIHSAVVSLLEKQMFVAEFVHVEEMSDRTRILSLAQAKCEFPFATEILQDVAVSDLNNLKIGRSPGVLSVYQVSTSAIRCAGEAYIYVRWVRSNENLGIIAFALSNGAVQVMCTRHNFELRWLDPTRRFLIRSSGQCELINQETFTLQEEIESVLFDPIVSEE